MKILKTWKAGKGMSALALCEYCGTEKELSASRAKAYVSCGCARYRIIGEKKTTHGHYRGKRASLTRKAWEKMIGRCTNPKSKDWPLYGGRGITVSPRWLGVPDGFLNFLADMGEKPDPKLSLDRIDTNGNYEPGNVRWATAKEQRHNTRQPLRVVTMFGETVLVRDWMERLKLSSSKYYGHFSRHGGDHAEAVLHFRDGSSWAVPEAAMPDVAMWSD